MAGGGFKAGRGPFPSEAGDLLSENLKGGVVLIAEEDAEGGRQSATDRNGWIIKSGVNFLARRIPFEGLINRAERDRFWELRSA